MAADNRFHALDATRAFALLLGIVLHATMSFFLFVPAQDSSPSTALGVTFYVVHIFRMSLFYFIAGFFAHLVFQRRGTRLFVKDRAKRILAPMIGGWVVFAPLTIAAVVWGLSKSFPDGPPPGADATALQPAGLPLTHLWFLYYLSIFYVVTLTVRAAFVRFLDTGGRMRARIDTVTQALTRAYVAPFVAAAPIFVVLVQDPAWLVWFGIPTPDTGLAPKLPAMIGYGSAFVLGWIVHRQPELLRLYERQWRVNLGSAVALTVACLWIAGIAPNLAAPMQIDGGPGMRALYAACYTAAIWFWSYGIIGAAMRFCSKPSALRRYLADSSYWLYLAHLPLVFTLQVLAMNVPLHWSIKFPLIVAIAVGLLLLSYHYVVRPTFIGEILNGRRHPRRAAGGGPAPAPDDANSPRGKRNSSADDELTPVAQLSNVSKRFGSTLALDDLTLAVERGELLALLGPNGAGKSTAIGIWLGLLEQDAGSAQLIGGEPHDVRSRLDVGVMMQDVNLAPELTAREHIARTSSYYRDPLTVKDVVALTDIETFADKRYGNLSGGQKRQVQFAVAVCGRPRLLFLDEPTTGLDVRAREALWATIRSLLSNDCSIVLTTHYLEEAEALADRVAVMARGRVLACGSVDEMRALVARKRISCATSTAADEIRRWPDVVDATRDNQLVRVTAVDAEAVLRRLLAADPLLSRLEVTQATLAEAFTELTKEAA